MLKSPFPWFGGKSRAVDVVWPRLGGDLRCYIEPFAGSLAMLLGRPAGWSGIEIVNDLDCHIANFWRALQYDPSAVAAAADWPANEVDLVARQNWLVGIKETLAANLRSNHTFCDPTAAGIWVWGVAAWIGSGFCEREIMAKLPQLSLGTGVLKESFGVTGDRRAFLEQIFDTLRIRIRELRVACGDWQRVLSDAAILSNTPTGVFLDPPYSSEFHDVVYSGEKQATEERMKDLGVAVREWAITHGDIPKLRIALCGYEGEHEMPDGWVKVPWQARKGYRKVVDEDGKHSGHNERIWFSPHCLKVTDRIWEVGDEQEGFASSPLAMSQAEDDEIGTEEDGEQRGLF